MKTQNLQIRGRIKNVCSLLSIPLPTHGRIFPAIETSHGENWVSLQRHNLLSEKHNPEFLRLASSIADKPALNHDVAPVQEPLNQPKISGFDDNLAPVLPESDSPVEQPNAPASARKLPRPVFETIYAFAPNRDTMGGTAYIVMEETGNILVDCPALDDDELQFLQQQGGVRWLFLTHRGGIGKVRELRQQFGCEIVIQEQEAYLLPGQKVSTFQSELLLSPSSVAIWTPGYSPGSSCLHHARYGGVLFSGRHLLPNAQGSPLPLRIAKTFHWPRQLRSVEQLRDRFSSETLAAICPGANTGFLRGDRYIDQAYEKLQTLDLESMALQKPGL